MYRKLIFSTPAILALLAGCVPAQFEVGVEPTATPTVTAPETAEPTATPEHTESILEPTQATAEFGEVSGAVCFPSEYIPPMTIWFRDTSDGMLYSAPNGENQATYASQLPAGTYIAFAYPDDMGDFGGMYSEAVSCGLTVECVNHAPLPFDVFAGATTTGIDICDWYAEPAQVPLNPNATFQTSPTLAGLFYRDLNAGGIWRVGEGGLARPVVDRPDVVISPDGNLALFEMDEDVFLADLAAGTWHNLTDTPDRWESNPRFIPGGAGLVFFLSNESSADRISGYLSVAGQDGSGYAVLVDQPVSLLPAFSPDGSRMAYSLGDTAWIYDLATRSSTAFETTVFGLSGIRAIASPSWSPDGGYLAWWVVTGEPADSQTALALFDLASNTHRLIHSYQPVGGGGFNSAAVWSPDGRWMAATVLSEGSKAALWVFSTNGGEISLGDLAYPIWTADGGALIATMWPADGGPAWESTAVLYLAEEWAPNMLDLRPGSIPIGFVDQ